jgi:hypothetical protein
LQEIPTDLDLIEAAEPDWVAAEGERLVRAALRSSFGCGVAVATKLLQLKRPRLFPMLDALVAQMLGQPTSSSPTSAATSR